MSHWVEERLREAILDGRFASGTWLRQKRLAEEFGMSQMPIREALKDLADEVVDRLGSGATVLGAEVDGKVALVAKVSEDLISLGAHAGNLVKAVAERAGGGGGGAPGFAQAGGGEPGKLPAAIEGAAAALADQLGAQEA